MVKEGEMNIQINSQEIIVLPKTDLEWFALTKLVNEHNNVANPTMTEQQQEDDHDAP